MVDTSTFPLNVNSHAWRPVPHIVRRLMEKVGICTRVVQEVTYLKPSLGSEAFEVRNVRLPWGGAVESCCVPPWRLSG